MSRLFCCMLLLCAAWPGTFPLHAQEHGHDRTVPPRPDLPRDGPAAEVTLLRDVRPDVFMPGFREYNLMLEEEERLIALRNMMMITLRLSGLQDDRVPPRQSDMDIIHANLGTDLALCRSSINGWKMLGYIVLTLAAQFALSYARETLMGRRTDELDYLYLPRGPGVVRTFSEARTMALWQGKIQAMETWYDFYWSVKNKPPCYPR